MQRTFIEIPIFFNIFRLLKGLPNTYAYTKGLTEHLVNGYSGKIPIVITRPSIGKVIYLFYSNHKGIDFFSLNFI